MQCDRPPFTSYPDEELVVLAQDGDNDAFAELIRRHQPGCLKQALSILRDRGDAEDEVQNACWKAFANLHQFNREARFSTWLTRIVVNQCLMRLRKERRAKFLYLDEALAGEETVRLDLPDDSLTPEQELGESQVSSVLEHEVGRMPTLLRKVFLLREVQELSMAEVAEHLGISIPAAKSRLLRARLELRTRMEKHQGRLGLGTLVSTRR